MQATKFRVIGLHPKKKNNSKVFMAETKKDAREFARTWVVKRGFTAYEVKKIGA